MLGMEGGWVSLAYGLCLASTLICIIYGLANWNKDVDEEPQPEDVSWAREEEEVEKTVEP